MLILFIISFILFIAFFIGMRIRERRFLKKKVHEVWGPEMQREIQKEKDDFMRRQNRFEASLNKKASKK